MLPILGLVGGLAPLSIDMYLPALPDMARSLDASDAMLQMTVTAFLVGFALGPLVLGPVSDAVGRRAVMLAAIAVFVVASLLCAWARSAEELIAYRILQAVSGGSAATLSGAVVNDQFEGDRVARAMSILMLIMSVAPMVAPTLGGQLLVHFGWQANFLALAGIGLAAALAVFWGLPETVPAVRRRSVRPARVALGYLDIVTSVRAMAFALAGAFAGGAMFAYIAATPFIYIDFYGLDPQLYGLFFAANIGGAMIVNMINVRFVVALGYRRILAISAFVFLAVGVALLVASSTGLGGLWGIAVTVFWVVGLAHIMGANGVTGVLSFFGERAGAASAVNGALRFLAGVTATLMIGALNDGTPWSLGAVIMGCAVISATATAVALRGQCGGTADAGA
ncbi:MAG: multidrug effflux MFS transporter [Alphaproteobacteria bacterium]